MRSLSLYMETVGYIRMNLFEDILILSTLAHLQEQGAIPNFLHDNITHLVQK